MITGKQNTSYSIFQQRRMNEDVFEDDYRQTKYIIQHISTTPLLYLQNLHIALPTTDKHKRNTNTC